MTRFWRDIQDGPRVLFCSGSRQVFLYTLLLSIAAGLIIQIVLLPYVVPQLHAGNGLLLAQPDSVGFHAEAVALAHKISLSDWGALTLRPQNNAPIAVAAIVYAITGVTKPWILVPLHAALFALGAVGLFNIYARIVGRTLSALAALPYALLPSSVLMYSQIHKDVWTSAGFIWLVFVVVALVGPTQVRMNQVLALAGVTAIACLSTWLMRPYLVQVFAAGFLCAITLEAARDVTRLFTATPPKATKWIGIGICLGIILAFVMNWPETLANRLKLNIVAPSTDLLIERDLHLHPMRVECIRDDNDLLTQLLPNLVQRRLQAIADARDISIQAGGTAGSTIDRDVCLHNAGDVVRYIPRAIQIGLFAPFPNMWFKAGASAETAKIRILAGVEIAVTSILLMGFFPLLFLAGMTPLRISAAVSIFAITVLTITSVAIPNIGTLVRVRYSYLSILAGLGVVGWSLLSCALWQFWRDRR